MRINKLLSNFGYCSRKEANRWIEAGRVDVNGVTAIQGQWVEMEDTVLVDKKQIQQQPLVYLMLNKPVGIECTAESEVSNNVIDYIGYPQYIFPIGRLDKDSQGLLILTNDGMLAHRLLDAEHHKEKAYEVTLDRVYDDVFIEKMSSGLRIDRTLTRPCEIKKLSDLTFEIILTQGMNRQIRKMCALCGYKVEKLERIRILNLELGELPYGAWRALSDLELKIIKTELEATYETP